MATRYKPVSHPLVEQAEVYIAALKKKRYVQRNGKRTGFSRLPKGCKFGWYKARAFCRGRASYGQLGVAEDALADAKTRYASLLRAVEFSRYPGQVAYANAVIEFCNIAMPAIAALKNVRQVKEK